MGRLGSAHRGPGVSFVIRLQKENFKFSCTHFTIFGAQQAERLHGHNYYVRCEIEVDGVQDDLGLAFDFNVVKPEIKALCDERDERILFPERSPYLRISVEERQTRVAFQTKEYLLPNEDVLKLPLVNITSEELARHFCHALEARLAGKIKYRALAIEVEETLGQSVKYRLCTS